MEDNPCPEMTTAEQAPPLKIRSAAGERTEKLCSFGAAPGQARWMRMCGSPSLVRADEMPRRSTVVRTRWR